MGAGMVYNPAIAISYCVRLDKPMFVVAVENDESWQNSIKQLVDGALT
jgi:hypothetical protein